MIITMSPTAIIENVDILPPTRALRPMRYRLREETTIIFPSSFSSYKLVIPAGFISDGASVPRMFQGIFPPFGMYMVAALVHDYYCDLANRTGNYHIREYADNNFHYWVRQCGVSQLRAKPMSAAVKTYGRGLKLTGKLS